MASSLKTELNQSTFDLFSYGGNAASDLLAPIGLIRVPMKESPTEPDEHTNLNDPTDALEGHKSGRNFRLDNVRNLAGGWKSRAQDNLAAIRLLQAIEAAGRPATADEQAELIKFCAFSSTELAQNVFRRNGEEVKQGWAQLVTELEALVTAEEKAGLMRATQYAHYTPEYIIRAMWDVVANFGFQGGSILEPGCGTGLFLAACPAAIADKSFFCGIEADPITARIASLLYPESDIRLGDFTKAKLGGDYDLVIGNPPFSDRTQRFTDVRPSVPLSLHDFFIARSICNLRPGGIAAFVVSRWTMDKQDQTARELIAERADLVGAVRLPARAMRQDAGTDVVVDLLFFRRREEGEAPNGVDWLDTAEALPQTEDSEAFCVNQYFIERPKNVLGHHSRTTSPYGLVYTCEGPTGQELETALDAALATLPADIHTSRPETFRRPQDNKEVYVRNIADGATIREGSYLVIRRCLHQVIDGRPLQVAIKRGRAKGEGISLKAAEIIECLIPIRDAVRDILRAQESNRPWADAQVALRRAHARFLRAFGPINKTEINSVVDEETGATKEYVRRPNLAPFMDDPDVWLVSSIEDYDAETGKARHGAIFSQRVVNPPAAPIVLTAADALTVCLHDIGYVDLDFMAESLGVTAEQIQSDLAGAIFLNPETQKWETADAYLSGPVRTKLALAIAASETDARYSRNVEALQAAQPTDLQPSEITARLGAPWISVSDVEAFSLEVLGVKTTIHHVVGLGSWSLNTSAFAGSASCTTEWGTPRRHAGLLLEDALNAAIPQIYDTYMEDGKERRELNASETEAAKEKLSKIKTTFQTWVWTDAERAERLCRVYNDTMNNLVPRHFDGSHLTLPGASNIISFYAHQKRGIWRTISAGSTYLGHAVGAGKTFTMAAAIMEQKRLGLISKAMMVVPGHCLAQASREFLQLYPTAKILVADETNFVKAKRQRFIARAATADWDCIIITHSAFRFIAIPAAFEKATVQKMIDDFEDMLDTVDSDDRVSRKQIERQKEGFEARLESLSSTKDDLLTISEIGVDHLVVDEAQEFRKLAFSTNQSTLKGIDPNGSQRAWDLYVKAQFIETHNPGRSLIMASGTPITNTMGELFTLQRFFVPDLLTRMGIQTFDAWASNFGDSKTELELQPSGTYKPVTRFAEFVNVPELIDIFRSFADIVQKSDLRQHLRLPKIVTGKRQMVTAEPSREFQAYQRVLDRRIKAIENRTGRPKKGDDILLSVITDGRHAAIDLRFVAPHLADDPGSKLNKLIDNVWRIYQETSDNVYYSAPGVPYEVPGGGQMIFSDLGTLSVESKRGFSAYRWIKTRLVALGVPESEIAFVQDYKKTSEKQRLFADFRAGKKRIAVGSSQMMGTGVNAQVRLVALHHLDVPWIPSDIEQREGRIERQGNQNEEINIYCYATLTSMDATMWGQNSRKQKFVEAALSGDRSVRKLEDAGSQANQFSLAKAISSGDQRLMQKAGLEAEIHRLYRLRDSHIESQIGVRRSIADARSTIEFNNKRVICITQDLEQRTDTRGDLFRLSFDGADYVERKAAGAAIIKAILESGWHDRKLLGEAGGIRFGIKIHRHRDHKIMSSHVVLRRNGDYREEIDLPEDPSPLGVIARIESALTRFESQLDESIHRIEDAKRRLADFEPRLGQVFDMQAELDAKCVELEKLDEDLAASTEAAANGEPDELEELTALFARSESIDPFDDETEAAPEMGDA
jgi:N12 class adenine-specific DNA methylase